MERHKHIPVDLEILHPHSFVYTADGPSLARIEAFSRRILMVATYKQPALHTIGSSALLDVLLRWALEIVLIPYKG